MILIFYQGHDSEWPSTDFDRRSSFVKKLRTKKFEKLKNKVSFLLHEKFSTLKYILRFSTTLTLPLPCFRDARLSSPLSLPAKEHVVDWDWFYNSRKDKNRKWESCASKAEGRKMRVGGESHQDHDPERPPAHFMWFPVKMKWWH